MGGFCTNCGSPLGEGAAFCGNCGTPSEATSVPAPPPTAAAAAPQPATTPPAVTTPPPAPPAQSGNPFLKVVAIVLGFFALVTVIGIGSCLYVGYRVKQKADEIASKAGEVKEQVAPLAPQRTVIARPCPAVDPSHSQAFRTAAASASIPLRPGLTLVSIWTLPARNAHDIEILDTVEAIDGNTIKVVASTSETDREEYKFRRATRILCISDLLSGRQVETAESGDSESLTAVPETIAGATKFSMSQAMFQDLKAGRPAELEYFEAHQTPWSFSEYGIIHDFTVRLARVEPDDVPYSVIVNGVLRDLPALHVKGRSQDNKDDLELFVLDDPANPIILNLLGGGSKSYIKYVKINFLVEKKIEQDLARGCAEVYGIYFGFDSDRLRPESEPALKEIADALGHNPAWKVKIDGHTDNIGGDAYNMALSSQRAEAVQQALSTRYQVSSNRLSSEGFGARRPKGPNDTPEARALNRRVELCRQ